MITIATVVQNGCTQLNSTCYSLPFFSLTGLISGGADTSIDMHTDVSAFIYGSGNEGCARASVPSCYTQLVFLSLCVHTVLVVNLHTFLCIWLQDVWFVFSFCVVSCNAMPKYTTITCVGLVIVCYCFMAAHCPSSPLTSWTNPCRRVRELEEELRQMDQNLKSMVCGEEEVLTVTQVQGLILTCCLPSAPLACRLSAPLSVFCLICSLMDDLCCFSCQQIPWKSYIVTWSLIG